MDIYNFFDNQGKWITDLELPDNLPQAEKDILIKLEIDDINMDAEEPSELIAERSVIKTGPIMLWETWAGGLPKCPSCGYEYTDKLECTNFCGNCGARLEFGYEYN